MRGSFPNGTPGQGEALGRTSTLLASSRAVQQPFLPGGADGRARTQSPPAEIASRAPVGAGVPPTPLRGPPQRISEVAEARVASTTVRQGVSASTSSGSHQFGSSHQFGARPALDRKGTWALAPAVSVEGVNWVTTPSSVARHPLQHQLSQQLGGPPLLDRQGTWTLAPTLSVGLDGQAWGAPPGAAVGPPQQAAGPPQQATTIYRTGTWSKAPDVGEPAPWVPTISRTGTWGMAPTAPVETSWGGACAPVAPPTPVVGVRHVRPAGPPAPGTAPATVGGHMLGSSMPTVFSTALTATTSASEDIMLRSPIHMQHHSGFFAPPTAADAPVRQAAPLRRTQTLQGGGVSANTSAPAQDASKLLRKARTFDPALRTGTRAASASPQGLLVRGAPAVKMESEERAASTVPPRTRSRPLPAEPAATAAGASAGAVQEERPLPLEKPAELTPQELGRAGREILAAALSTGPEWKGLNRQLRLVVAGLMGSGKSSLCRALCNLLGGVWVNQDEFSHLGKRAKTAFLAEVRRVAAAPEVPVLLIDKINTLQQHRRDIMEAIQAGCAGDTMLLQMRHPLDAPGRWNQAVRLCESRIRERGAGHRTLRGDDPKLRRILEMTANGIEPMTENELAQFLAHLTVDMTLEPHELVRYVLQDLDEADVLMQYNVLELMKDQRISDAVNSAKAVEMGLAGHSDKPVKPGRSMPKSNPAKGPQGPEQVWLWAVELDNQSCMALRNLWQQYSHILALNAVEEYHITLLYVGCGSDSEVASRNPGLGGPARVQQFRQALAAREGQEVQAQAVSLVWDNRVATVEVTGIDGLGANRNPHVTLAIGPREAPRISNELLARKAASASISMNLGPWMQLLGLEQYTQGLMQWCLAMGAASPDEIAENAEEAAAALEPGDLAARGRLEEVLRRSAQAELQVIQFQVPLQLTGHIHGRLRNKL